MRKSLKLKRELDVLELDVQLWGVKYHSLLVNCDTLNPQRVRIVNTTIFLKRIGQSFPCEMD